MAAASIASTIQWVATFSLNLYGAQITDNGFTFMDNESYEQIEIDYDPGEVRSVTMHDGSRILLKKLEEDYDPSNAVQALKRLHEAVDAGQMLTGLVYVRPEKPSFISHLNLVDEPLHSLTIERTRPSREALEKIMKELM